MFSHCLGGARLDAWNSTVADMAKALDTLLGRILSELGEDPAVGVSGCTSVTDILPSRRVHKWPCLEVITIYGPLHPVAPRSTAA